MEDDVLRKLARLAIVTVVAAVCLFGTYTIIDCERNANGQPESPVACRATTRVAWVPIDHREYQGVVAADLPWHGSDSGGNYSLDLISATFSGPTAPLAPFCWCRGCAETATRIEAFLEDASALTLSGRIGFMEFLWLGLLVYVVAEGGGIVQPHLT